MLESVKIARRQSEIRQQLATLAAKDQPTDDEVRQLETLDKEYRTNETRYRASLIAEDQERKTEGVKLETREGREWDGLLRQFEVRQVASYFDEQRELSGPTAEVVKELRAKGSYRGVPVPIEALETRAGETVASGTPDPKFTAPIIDRIFAQSVAGRLGASFLNINSGLYEVPVVSSSISAGWAATETGNVSGPTQYTTVDRPMSPSSTLGIQVRLTRKALKQSGDALEQAVRRDLLGAVQTELDKAAFIGSGASGQPLGIITAATNSPQSFPIHVEDVSALLSYSVLKGAFRRMADDNAAMQPTEMRWLIRPLSFSILDGDPLTGTAESEWDRAVRRFGAGAFTISDNALPASAAEDGTGKGAHVIVASALTGGVPPIFVATWGALDMIRDPFSDAQSGGLRLTALLTADVTISRAQQLQILENVQDRA